MEKKINLSVGTNEWSPLTLSKIPILSSFVNYIMNTIDSRYTFAKMGISITPGKKYLFNYKSGKTMESFITRVDSHRISGIARGRTSNGEAVKFSFVYTYKELKATIETISEMKQTHKTNISSLFIILLIPLLSSCFTYKSITKKDESITPEIQSKLIPGNKYLLTYKGGNTLKVDIAEIDSTGIHGMAYGKVSKGKEIKYSYSSTFENLATVDKISQRKFSPGLTLACALPFVFIVALTTAEYPGFTW